MILAGLWHHGRDYTDHKTVIGYLPHNCYNSVSSWFFFRCISTPDLWPDWHGMKNAIETELSRLMHAALKGDTGKYQDFLKKAVNPIRSQISRIMPFGILADRDDIVQDVLFAIHQKRQTWRIDKPILPWIRAIAKYRTIDYLRRHHRQQTITIDQFANDLIAQTQDPIVAIDLTNMVRRLKGRPRLVMEAIGLEGKDITSTALALNISENAVRIAFHRGLKTLSQLCQQKQKGHNHDPSG